MNLHQLHRHIIGIGAIRCGLSTLPHCVTQVPQHSAATLSDTLGQPSSHLTWSKNPAETRSSSRWQWPRYIVSNRCRVALCAPDSCHTRRLRDGNSGSASWRRLTCRPFCSGTPKRGVPRTHSFRTAGVRASPISAQQCNMQTIMGSLFLAGADPAPRCFFDCRSLTAFGVGTYLIFSDFLVFSELNCAS